MCANLDHLQQQKGRARGETSHFPPQRTTTTTMRWTKCHRVTCLDRLLLVLYSVGPLLPSIPNGAPYDTSAIDCWVDSLIDILPHSPSHQSSILFHTPLFSFVVPRFYGLLSKNYLYKNQGRTPICGLEGVHARDKTHHRHTQETPTKKTLPQ